MKMAGHSHAPNRGIETLKVNDLWQQVKVFAKETGIMLRVRDGRFWYGPYSAADLAEMRRVLIKLKRIAE